ncbi:site-specific DNA-methyltransferase [Alicyclobacillus tolerans]|uniref:DNA methyltransferase n=1 Tax=Alicyclobacillus tolerans TaxID=90970 RepID=UPI001F2DB5CC|nr:DNA methyltransferase [Alicyclobacillus tolerans]MCF8567889.1 site-specific DNA-methyltransferase [Alicyclobacillus tolerans]
MGKQTKLDMLIQGSVQSNDFQSVLERKDATEVLSDLVDGQVYSQIKGFPVAGKQSILSLSVPPLYTASPNPFIKEWIESTSSKEKSEEAYYRDAFSADVSEGKNDPVYNVHTYHTKVPHKALMRYILHYTEPGDIVFDGFAGTGMTGVAAQLCGDQREIESLGFKVLDGYVKDNSGETISKFGARYAILADLSPTATFIAHNYCNLSENRDFAAEALDVVDRVEEELQWLYNSGGRKVVSAVWSDVFLCPNCNAEILFWDMVQGGADIQKPFACPSCRSMVGKSESKKAGVSKLERPFEVKFDRNLNEVVSLPKFVMVEQTIGRGQTKSKVSVSPADYLNFVQKFNDIHWPKVPTNKFMPGRQTNKLINGSGISYICHMYTPRALFAYATLWEQQLTSPQKTAMFRFCLSAINNYISRKQGYFGGGGGVNGTLFTPSIHLERNVFDVLRRKIKAIQKVRGTGHRTTIVSTQSATDLRNIPDNTIDYIFTDPPFGESIQYSELNSFVEAWLGVHTRPEEDCVLNYVHKKDHGFYGEKMAQVFAEYARILKPGRWITIEFHNSQNSVWTAIQQAVESARLLVADVRLLDKQQRSFNAVNRAGAVNQDLVISAYKPRTSFEQRFREGEGQPASAIEFVREYLSILSPSSMNFKGKLELIPERTRFVLFDRMVAYHLVHNARIPLTAAEFYNMLNAQFMERDGMYFLPDQAAKYDAIRVRTEVEQLSLFIRDERTAVQWVRNQLSLAPQTLGELTPKFLQELREWDSHETRLELRDLLNENFILGEDGRWRVPDPNSTKDLELLKQKALLKIFERYVKSKGTLKVFRKEAVLEGFRLAWQTKQYSVIVQVSNKIPQKLLQEIPELLQFCEIARDYAPVTDQLEFQWDSNDIQ